MTHSKAACKGTPTLLGIPLDENSSYLRGPAKAPPLIREALRCDAGNMFSEMGVDLGASGAFADAGDLKLPAHDAFAEIEKGVCAVLEQTRRPVCLGGDHSITYPIVRAINQTFARPTIVHFDAHPDLYDEFQGSRHSHACPFARIMEEGLARQLIQIGIRTLNPHQKDQAARFDVQLFEMRKLPVYDALKRAGPVYVSIDVDVLDPSCAPGISHREPGGMTARELINHLHEITGTIVGADLVEYNPDRDISGLTATVCGKLLKEVMGKMIGG